jgi:hypothetical protein
MKHFILFAVAATLLLPFLAVSANAQECTQTPLVTTQDALNASAAWEIWNNNYKIAGNNDKSGIGAAQINMINSKITEDFHNVETAIALSQVRGCNVEVLYLLDRYKAMFKPGDASFNAAYGYANEITTQLNTLGIEATSRIGEQPPLVPCTEFHPVLHSRL